MVSHQVASAVTVTLCASSAPQMASVSRWAVRGERLAMRVRTRALPASLSAVGVPQRASASRAPPLEDSLSPRARSSAGDTVNRASLSRLAALVASAARSASRPLRIRSRHQQLVAGGRPAQAVGVAPGVVGEHRGVFGVGLGRPGVKVRGAPHREARHIGHRDLSASGRLQQQRRRRGSRVDHQSDRAVHRGVRRSGARSPPRRCARCAPAPRRRPMSQRRRSGRLWRCRRRRTPRCRRSRVLAWRNSLGPGTFSVGCSRRLRLNHFTSSPEGMSLSEVPGTRPRRATTPPGPTM